MSEQRDMEAKEMIGVQVDGRNYLWVCVDGACVLRVRGAKVEITDLRKPTGINPDAVKGLLAACEGIAGALQPATFDENGECETWLAQLGPIARGLLLAVITKAKGGAQ